MRIIGEFDADNVKVTVFSMNGRLSIKFERDLLEQTFKFRDGSPIQNVEDVKRFCSPQTMQEINQLFTKMQQLRYSGMESMASENESTFEFIM